MRAPFARAVKGLLAFAIVLLVVGCAATPPAPPPAPPPAEPAEPPELADAAKLVEKGSPDSLAKAAQSLAAPPLAENAAAANLAAAGRALHAILYPEIPDPFPADTAAFSGTGPGAPGFLALVLPALSRLRAGTAVPDAQAADLAKSISEASALNGESVLPPYLEGLLGERQGKNADSLISLYRESLGRDPSFYPAKARIVELLLAQGSREKAAEALPYLGELAARFPPDASTYRSLARASLAAGKAQEAADAAARALLLDSADPSLVLLRAEAYEALGDWYQALHLLEALLSQKPDEAPAILMEARLLFEEAGNAEEAVRVLTAGEAAFPKDPAFPELRGRILLEKRKSAEGIAALNRSLALQPGLITALTLLAQEASRAKDWSQAAEIFSRIPEVSRTAEHLALGWRIATGLGDHAQALGYAQALAGKSGGDAPMLLSARSLLSLGRNAEALEMLTRGLQTASSAARRSEMYVLRAAAGSEDPLRDLRSALREEPDNAEALVAISEALSQGGEHRKALGYMKRAAELSPGDADLARKVGDLETLAESEK